MRQSVHRGKRKSSSFGFAISVAFGASSPLYDGNGDRKYLTILERQAFLRAADKLPGPKRTFCRMLAYTGARLSEVLALTTTRIDCGAGLVVFESLKKRRRGIFRAVPLPRSFFAELEGVHTLLRARGDAVGENKPLWFFGRTTGWKVVKTALSGAGIVGAQASPKGLRHAFAVSALQAGVPLNLVRRWMGHSRLSTTAIYADAIGAEEQLLAARFWTTF